MGNHPFNVIVVLFWLATMTWLVVAKVLPPLRVGEPPSYRSILDESRQQTAACWAFASRAYHRLGGQQDGAPAKTASAEFYSRVYLAELPLDEVAPGWLDRPCSSPCLPIGAIGRRQAKPDGRRPVGPACQFRVARSDRRDSRRHQGARARRGLDAQVTVRSGDSAAHRSNRTMPPNALMTDELSPQAMMPGFARRSDAGRCRCTVRFASPPVRWKSCKPTSKPANRIRWDGRSTQVSWSCYRGDPGRALAATKVRGRMWVRDDGLVLRQEVAVCESPSRFEPSRSAGQ